MRAILLVLSSDKPTTVWNMEGSSLVRCAEQILRVYLVPLNVIAKKKVLLANKHYATDTCRH